MFTTSLSSSIWNPSTYRPPAPAWRYPTATRTHADNHDYEFNFKHPGLSSPGRRPPVRDMRFSHSHCDLSPMVTSSPERILKMVEKSKPVCSPIVIPDSPSPSVITISSSSDRSNSLDITGKCISLHRKYVTMATDATVNRYEKPHPKRVNVPVTISTYCERHSNIRHFEQEPFDNSNVRLIPTKGFCRMSNLVR